MVSNIFSLCKPTFSYPVILNDLAALNRPFLVTANQHISLKLVLQISSITDVCATENYRACLLPPVQQSAYPQAGKQVRLLFYCCRSHKQFRCVITSSAIVKATLNSLAYYFLDAVSQIWCSSTSPFKGNYAADRLEYSCVHGSLRLGKTRLPLPLEWPAHPLNIPAYTAG